MRDIYVSKPFLPDIDDYIGYMREIWDRNYLTNQGPLLKKFESNVEEYLGVKNFHFVTNGTIALQIALRSLGIEEGEVITTPFSYVATTSSILWERCDPVFVDIEPETYCIDPKKIEEAITPKTRAIMAVHVFGNPCAVNEIDAIAKKYKLKVIYDGAHAFGVSYKGKSLLGYGDISMCSFHATKVFHTIEGGGLFVSQNSVSEKVELMKRFGHNVDEHIMLGINAKASEFQAAMGLSVLKYLDTIIGDRKKISDMYDRLLNDNVSIPKNTPDTKRNFAYYPVVFQDEATALNVVKKLSEKHVFPRRYFYPSLNTLPYLKKKTQCKVSENIASRILCLPLYSGLESNDVQKIADLVNEASQ